MIPRLSRPRGLNTRTEPMGRPLKIVVDEKATAGDAMLPVLLGFGRHPDVEVWVNGTSGARLFMVGGYLPGEDRVDFRHDEAGKWGMGRAQHVSFYLSEIPRLQAQGFPATEQELEKCLCMYAAAEAFDADALVTSGTMLRLRDWPVPGLSGMSLLAPAEALGLIGLKLRTRRHFKVPCGAAGFLGIDRPSYHWVITRDTLPAGWRWHSSALNHRGSRLSHLTSSTLVRFSQALRARDACQIELQLSHDPDLDEVLYHLDALFYSLAGAFDSAAHVADRVELAAVGADRVGWRKRKWVTALSRVAPELAALVSEGSDGQALLTCLHELRNLVHEEVLGQSQHGLGKGREQFLSVPPLRRRRQGKSTLLPEVLLDATRQLGGEAIWGLRYENAERCLIEPDRYIEELVAHSVSLLNEIMTHTRAPSPNSQDGQAPRAWAYNEEIHRVLNLLGAVGPPPATRLVV